LQPRHRLGHLNPKDLLNRQVPLPLKNNSNLNRDKLNLDLLPRLGPRLNKPRHNLAQIISNQKQEKLQMLVVEKVHRLFHYHLF
jgi:hypothetical protein